jgi:hypothetical protein
MFENNFSVEIDGVEKEFEIKAASLNEQREAQKFYNQAFSDAVKSGSIVRAKLDDLLKEQDLWDDKKEIEFVTIQKQLADKEKKLSKGGISLKTAKAIAIEMKGLRDNLRELISVKSNLDTHTAEGQADNARFNYLVSVCVVYKDTKKPYFAGYDDYINRSIETVALVGAQKMASLMYGLDSDFEKKLPENKFLLKYKLVNDKLEYVDDKGRQVDQEGRLVDKDGRFINEEGKFVDRDGNLVTDSGDYVVEFEPFLDDEGNPIAEVKDESNNKSEESSPPV